MNNNDNMPEAGNKTDADKRKLEPVSRSFFRAALDIMSSPFTGWMLDQEKTAQHANYYYENRRTGDRMAVYGGGGYQPFDMAWLAETANKATIKDADKTTVYFREDLAQYRNAVDNPPKEENTPLSAAPATPSLNK